MDFATALARQGAAMSGVTAAGATQTRPETVMLGQDFWVWLRIAMLSFGGPAGQIAVTHRICPPRLYLCCFAAFLRRWAEITTAEDVRGFVLDHRERGVGQRVIQASECALRLLFRVTLYRPDPPRKLVPEPCPRELPDVLNARRWRG